MAKILMACELLVGDEILTHVDVNDPVRRRAIVLRSGASPHCISIEVAALIGADWVDFKLKLARDYPTICLHDIDPIRPRGATQ
ncbi:phage protein [Pseudomonas phage R26]|uniref:Phage protein n=1 Tax=Pseudomonas phage R26 TaxID=2562636 RepID=A0A455XGI9_9CAUD|nr:phage protein [Pseudomonas phage R26]BBJ26753.1 phage protein [Pseudomonas phage R26]